MGLDNAARINMLARRAGMSYGQYQAMVFEKNGYVATKKPEETETKTQKTEPKPSGKICVICGKPILGKVWGRTKTCSKACGYQLNLQRTKERFRALKQETQATFLKNCGYCGKEIRTNREYQRFCSDRCRNRYKAAVRRGVINPTPESCNMANRSYGKSRCGICGAEYTKRSPGQKFCTPECAHESRRRP